MTGLKKFSALFYPIRSKAKSNRDLLALNQSGNGHFILLVGAATTSIYKLRIQKMLISIDKCLHYNFNPKYLEIY